MLFVAKYSTQDEPVATCNKRQPTANVISAGQTHSKDQWRSQKCELGGSLPLPFSSPPLPLLTEVRGYNPRNFFEITCARR